mmetsp:Transcript_7075/g.12782  ORF Transcript_7075/g.12782 Transcript_7075/m.12782 type:complete len:217 (-) Transcript_7075:123-773(-)
MNVRKLLRKKKSEAHLRDSEPSSSLDLHGCWSSVLLVDASNAAICHLGTRDLLQVHLATLLLRSHHRNDLVAIIDQIWTLEERLMHVDRELIPLEASALHAHGSDGSRERNVGHTREHDLTHDTVVCVHSHWSRGEANLCDNRAITNGVENGVDKRMVDAAPRESALLEEIWSLRQSVVFGHEGWRWRVVAATLGNVAPLWVDAALSGHVVQSCLV